ncbi:MAG: hypothetical protein HY842_10540 [Bacteroidetes bacterium]|nr:hypothetical protein [Bacteroidota bacterium]
MNWRFLPLILMLAAGCYEPQEGCLDIEATNYEVSADDPCGECCKYPTLTLAVQHQVVLPTQLDTFYSFKYSTHYPSPFDTNHFFEVGRSRFFISDLKLVRSDGTAIGVQDSIWLPLVSDDSVWVEDNFAKADRDIFQPSAIGEIRTDGMFTQVSFTLGLSALALQTDPDSLPSGHPLMVTNDTLMYDSSFGYIPNLLVLWPDTLADTTPLTFRFTEGKQISLDLPQPVAIERGFNIKVTLRMNYMAWFDGVDFKNDSPAVMQAKIDGNLSKAFSVAEIKSE